MIYLSPTFFPECLECSFPLHSDGLLGYVHHLGYLGVFLALHIVQENLSLSGWQLVDGFHESAVYLALEGLAVLPCSLCRLVVSQGILLVFPFHLDVSGVVDGTAAYGEVEEVAHHILVIKYLSVFPEVEEYVLHDVFRRFLVLCHLHGIEHQGFIVAAIKLSETLGVVDAKTLHE